MNSFRLKKISKLFLLLLAIAIGGFSIWYTNKIISQLENEEKQKIITWANATKILTSIEETGDITFYLQIIEQNNTIPVILTDERENIISTRNIDSVINADDKRMKTLISKMKSINKPIKLDLGNGQYQWLFYDNSSILYNLKNYPFFQIGVISFFLLVSYLAFSFSKKSEQNLVWVGMSKETAHQLGTPLSSLLAWNEILKSNQNKENLYIHDEIEKDIYRLQTIAERFSKIGSEPVLEFFDLVSEVKASVDYIKQRSSKLVDFEFINEIENDIKVLLNPSIFAWVIENISKNAIDAMNGKGKLIFHISRKKNQILLDISDNGKGIPSSNFKTIFKPGYTTKKRGWGLGLTLAKRIIENYHKGKIFVKESIPNEKTTFRIILYTQ